jgi:hypothetical protein
LKAILELFFQIKNSEFNELEITQTRWGSQWDLTSLRFNGYAISQIKILFTFI